MVKETITNNRQSGLDMFAGILIIYMIMYHCFQHAELLDSMMYEITHRIFFFFMSWFYFKAGMFHKVKPEKVMVKTTARRLLIPFASFTLLAYFICCINYLLIGDFNIIHYTLSPIKQLLLLEAISWNLPLWFLPSLFIVKNIFNLWSLRYSSKWLLLLGIVACLTANDSEAYPIWIQNLAAGMFFYSAGYCLKDIKKSKFLLCICGGLYVLSLVKPNIVDFRTNILSSNSVYCLWLLFSLGSIIFYNRLFIATPPNMLRRNVFTYIGRNSMFFYCSHWIVIMIVKQLVKYSGIVMNSEIFFILLLLVEAFLLPLFVIIPQGIKIKLKI